jgi:protein ImuB
MFAAIHVAGNGSLLLATAEHFSPLVEETSRDTVVFDVRGLRWIYGGPTHIAAEIARRIGLSANIAIAANPDAAVHAALGLPGITILEPGREAKALAPLPLQRLGGSADFARTLDSWGIRTFGDFAKLPPLGVIARLGEEGATLQRLASGQGSRLLRLHIDPRTFTESLDLDEPVHLLEPLLEGVLQLLEKVFTRLRFHALAANQLRLQCTLERRPDFELTLALPVAVRAAEVLRKLLALELAQNPPQAPVTRIFVALVPAEARTAQHGLFVPLAPEPEKLEITLSRLRQLVGPSNVGAPELQNTHRPDCFALLPLSLGTPVAAGSIEAAGTMLLRRYRPPRALQVRMNGSGQPEHLRWSGVEHPVKASAGPWLASGDWWSHAWSRQEWDIETATGGLYRIYLDRMMGRWYVEGSYD